MSGYVDVGCINNRIEGWLCGCFLFELGGGQILLDGEND